MTRYQILQGSGIRALYSVRLGVDRLVGAQGVLEAVVYLGLRSRILRSIPGSKRRGKNPH